MYSLAPLPTPHAKASSLEQIRSADSVELFCARAAQVRPDFALSEDNASAVADICRRLDGIPLAIELAAARVRMMSPQEIAARLDQRFRFLTGSTRDALPQHRTLQALIEWSHGQLTRREQALFRRLAAFAGGWTLEAAEAVCVLDTPSDENPESWEVLDLLSGLIDKSLVELDWSSETGPRYQMLETIREFARLQLEQSGEAGPTSKRHLEYFDSFAAAMDEARGPRDEPVPMDRMERDHDNLRRAIETAFSESDPGIAVGLTTNVAWMRYIRGYWSEARRDLERALSIPGSDRLPYELLASAYNRLGAVASRQGDDEAAGRYWEAVIELASENGDERSVIRNRLNLVNVHERLGRYDEALDTCETILRMEGLEKGLRASTLVHLGGALYSLRRFAEAESRYRAGLELFVDLGRSDATATAKVMLAVTIGNLGRFQEAVQLQEEALEILRRMGDRWKIAACLANLASVRARLGQFEQIHAELAEASATALEMQEPRLIAGAIHGYALLAEHDGDLERSARLVGASEHIVHDVGDPAEDPGLRMRLRESLGTERFEELLAEGAGLSHQQAIALGQSRT